MANYRDLLQNARNASVLGNLERVSAEGLSVMEAQFEQVPSDYVAFLREVGAGPLGNDQYMLYTGVLRPDEIVGELSPELSELLLFGDDMHGSLHGFDQASWSVVEIDSAMMSIRTLSPSFESFIRSRISFLSAKK